MASSTYKCSYPSRKFLCKYALALLFLWAQSRVSKSGEVAEFASQWADAREARAARKTEPGQRTKEQRAVVVKRATQREGRITDDLAELDRFLADQLREGLATHAGEQSWRLEHMAARMVDVQAPGVASRLRELAAQPSSDNRPTHVVDKYGLLHLLARARAGREKLPGDLVAAVRFRIGLSTRTEDVLVTPGIKNRWVVLDMCNVDEEQVSVRRVWLWDRDTGTRVPVLFFARTDDGFDTGLYPGFEIDANLHFHPGRPRLRAVAGARRAESRRADGWDIVGDDVATAVAGFREAMAADPWCEARPVAIHGSLAWDDGAWLVAGRTASLTGNTTDHWRLLAELGATPATVFGELGADGLRPITYLQGAMVYPL